MTASGNPRKFIEKINQHKDKQLKEEAEFDKIMRDVQTITGSGRFQDGGCSNIVNDYGVNHELAGPSNGPAEMHSNVGSLPNEPAFAMQHDQQRLLHHQMWQQRQCHPQFVQVQHRNGHPGGCSPRGRSPGAHPHLHHPYRAPSPAGSRGISPGTSPSGASVVTWDFPRDAVGDLLKPPSDGSWKRSSSDPCVRDSLQQHPHITQQRINRSPGSSSPHRPSSPQRMPLTASPSCPLHVHLNTDCEYGQQQMPIDANNDSPSMHAVASRQSSCGAEIATRSNSVGQCGQPRIPPQSSLPDISGSLRMHSPNHASPLNRCALQPHHHHQPQQHQSQHQQHSPSFHVHQQSSQPSFYSNMSPGDSPKILTSQATPAFVNAEGGISPGGGGAQQVHHAQFRSTHGNSMPSMFTSMGLLGAVQEHVPSYQQQQMQQSMMPSQNALAHRNSVQLPLQDPNKLGYLNHLPLQMSFGHHSPEVKSAPGSPGTDGSPESSPQGNVYSPSSPGANLHFQMENITMNHVDVTMNGGLESSGISAPIYTQCVQEPPTPPYLQRLPSVTANDILYGNGGNPEDIYNIMDSLSGQTRPIPDIVFTGVDDKAYDPVEWLKETLDESDLESLRQLGQGQDCSIDTATEDALRQ